MNNSDNNIINPNNSDNIINLNNNTNILLIDKFWNEDIWNINPNHIHNPIVLNIINQLNKYNSILNDDSSRSKITINDNFDIEIIDKDNSDHIKKKINKIKKDNINFFKTHADCIY